MHLIDEKTGSCTFPIALVVSRFNEEITSRLLNGALERLKEKQFDESEIKVVMVPGAIEIPIVAQKLARLGTCRAIVALGAVIRGETSHYDSVCDQVSQGCQRVALDNSIPVIFGILTCDNEEQARERTGGAHGHKGKDAIDTAVEMVSLLARLEACPSYFKLER